MSTRHILPNERIVERIVDRVRSAAASSVLIRSLLLGTLAIGVTAGGVMAGALVVAPVVASATRPDATARVARALSGASASTTALARVAIDRALVARSELLAVLPTPITRFAPPVLAIVSIIGALTALLLRRTTPQRTLVPVSANVSSAPRGLARLTPHSSGRASGKRQRTPRAVEALAATGASNSDIAWRTGLPIDAIQVLLAISTATRQLQPPTA